MNRYFRFLTLDPPRPKRSKMAQESLVTKVSIRGRVGWGLSWMVMVGKRGLPTLGMPLVMPCRALARASRSEVGRLEHSRARGIISPVRYHSWR